MRLSLKINESPKEIQRLILKGLSQDLDAHILKNLTAINIFVKAKVYESIALDPLSWIVSNGKLKGDFGLDFDPVPAIAQAVSNSVVIDFIRLNNRLKGGLSIKVQPMDYLNLLTLPEGVVITEKGAQLPWLDWLLTYGNSIIIANFGVSYNYTVGRSGMMAIMVEGARPFSVDPSFSGTVNDNWITRAIDAEINNIEAGIVKILS